jgi:hypothetical protein
MREPVNGLEPRQSDRLHEIARDVTARIAIHKGNTPIIYPLPADAADDARVTDFLGKYFTHNLCKATIEIRKKGDVSGLTPGTYLILEKRAESQ